MALLLVAARLRGQNMGGASGLGAHHAARLRVAGAALLGEIADKIQHQGNIGAVAQKTPLLLHRQEAGIEHRLEMKRQGVGGDVELAGQLARDPPIQPRLDQQPPHIEPDPGCQRFKDLGGRLFVHVHSPWCELSFQLYKNH